MSTDKKDWLHQKRNEDFNKASGKTTQEFKNNKDYSREEMYRKLDNYCLTARNDKDLSFMNGLKDKYEDKINKKDAQTIERNRLFDAGRLSGLHHTTSLEQLDADRERSDQSDRNKTVKEAREYYRQNYSLRKKFIMARDDVPKGEEDKNR